MIFLPNKTKKAAVVAERHPQAKLQVLLWVISGCIPLGERLLDLGFVAASAYLLLNWKVFWHLLWERLPVSHLIRAVLIFCAICFFGAWAAGFEGGLYSAARLREHGLALVLCVGLHQAGSQMRWRMAGALAVGMLLSLGVAYLQFWGGLTPFAQTLDISLKQQTIVHPGFPDHLAGMGLLYDRIPFSILSLMFGIFALSVGLRPHLPQKRKMFFLVASMFAFSGPFVAGSRMAILLIPVGVLGVCWPFLTQLLSELRGKVLLLIGVSILITGVTFSLFGTQTSFRSVADTDQNQDRIFIWERALEIFVDKPIFGTGYGHYPMVAPAVYHTANPKRPAKNHAHNLVLTLLAETGFVGFWAFWWMMGCFFRRRFRAEVDALGVERGALWACVMFFLISLVHDPLFQSNTLACFWLFACLAAVPNQKGEIHDPS